MYKRIIFVRHGESTENVAHKNGNTYDKSKIVLTDKGKKQAKQTGEYLYKVFGKFDKVYTSPAKRCMQTSEIIINEIEYKIKPDIDNLLIELGFESNKLDGLSKEQENKIFDNIPLTNVPKNKLFNNIKTFRQLQKKLNYTENPYDKLEIYKYYSEIKNKYLDIKPNVSQVAKNYNKFIKMLKKTDDTNILVISHGACIRTLQKIICNIDPINMNFNFGKIDNCCILCLSINKNKVSLILPASINHLN